MEYCCCGKHHYKNQLVKKRVDCTLYFQVTLGKKGLEFKHSRNLVASAEAEAVNVCCLLTCSLHGLLSFFYTTQDNLPGGSITFNGLDSIISIVIQENILQTCLQAILLEVSSQLTFPLLDMSRFLSSCQKPSGTIMKCDYFGYVYILVLGVSYFLGASPFHTDLP